MQVKELKVGNVVDIVYGTDGDDGIVGIIVQVDTDEGQAVAITEDLSEGLVIISDEDGYEVTLLAENIFDVVYPDVVDEVDVE